MSTPQFQISAEPTGLPAHLLNVIRVLVTDPEQRAALAAVRSIGRQGWVVHTIGSSRGLAGVSNHTACHHPIARDVASEPTAYRDMVARITRSNGIDAVLPITDRASRALLGQDELLGAKIAGPTLEAYESASNKERLLAVAAQLGMRVPNQAVLSAPSEACTLDSQNAYVVKPARSVVESEGRTYQLSVRYVASASDLPQALGSYQSVAYPLLVQERVFGSGVGVFLLRKRGRTLLSFGHRRIREKPPAGGVSTYREAIDPPATLVHDCERLLDALDFEGPAMIEFKQAKSTGEYVLMEVNARLWGSVQLAVDAGVDFPAHLIASTLSIPGPALRQTKVGTRTFWELGELDHALALLLKSSEDLSLPPGHVVGMRAAARALLSRRITDRPEVFRWRDPLPFGSELIRWITRA